jgi:3',5'-cyclic AMP phosphodiesterase CpdA
VPGNHDRYVDKARAERLYESILGQYAQDHPDSQPLSTHEVAPQRRHLDGCVVIGLSSSVPSAPLVSAGRIHGRQLDGLASALTQARQHDALPIIALHHPPFFTTNPARRWVRGLRNAPDFGATIAGTSCLVLHGHLHERVLSRSPDGLAVGIGASSCSLGADHGTRRPGYNVYEIDTLHFTVRVSARTIVRGSSRIHVEHPWGVQPIRLRG